MVSISRNRYILCPLNECKNDLEVMVKVHVLAIHFVKMTTVEWKLSFVVMVVLNLNSTINYFQNKSKLFDNFIVNIQQSLCIV